MSESLQHKLDRVRPPRVQITYDVEIGNATIKKELPLVVGILADLVGQPENPPPKLKERKFVNIDPDNFDQVMERLGPRVKLVVRNRLKDDGSKVPINLKFNKLADFEPEAIARQVEPLRKLLDLRQRLVELISKLDGNQQLADLLKEIAADPARLDEVKGLLDKASR